MSRGSGKGARAPEARLEDLIGLPVIDVGGKPVGHLNEIRAEPRGGVLEVTEYLIGPSGLAERMPVLRVFRRAAGYRATWDQMDLADPERPRLTCPRSELARERPR